MPKGGPRVGQGWGRVGKPRRKPPAKRHLRGSDQQHPHDDAQCEQQGNHHTHHDRPWSSCPPELPECQQVLNSAALEIRLVFGGPCMGQVVMFFGRCSLGMPLRAGFVGSGPLRPLFRFFRLRHIATLTHVPVPNPPPLPLPYAEATRRCQGRCDPTPWSHGTVPTRTTRRRTKGSCHW